MLTDKTDGDGSILIRPLRPEEVPAARELVLAVAARLFQADAVETFIARHREGLADVDDFQTGYAPPAGLFLVARDGETLVGTGALRRLDDATAELRRMWLLEPYQGRGIGYRLWLELAGFARQAGYRRVRLTTDTASTRAIGFYERLGFRPIPAYNDSNEAIFMELAFDDH